MLLAVLARGDVARAVVEQGHHATPHAVVSIVETSFDVLSVKTMNV